MIRNGAMLSVEEVKEFPGGRLLITYKDLETGKTFTEKKRAREGFVESIDDEIFHRAVHGERGPVGWTQGFSYLELGTLVHQQLHDYYQKDPMITFTKKIETEATFVLRVTNRTNGGARDATPEDLAAAGYFPSREIRDQTFDKKKIEELGTTVADLRRGNAELAAKIKSQAYRITQLEEKRDEGLRREIDLGDRIEDLSTTAARRLELLKKCFALPDVASEIKKEIDNA